MNIKNTIKIAVAGNPNSGKSTIFNSLTGAKQHVGNYPGVTVEKKEGEKIYKDFKLNFVDLPGIYGLSAYSEDERIAIKFLLEEKPDLIIDILDSSNLERNLYLFTQLNELDIPMILVLNMSDFASQKGLKINENELSKIVGFPVIKTIGTKNKGIKELLDEIVKIKQNSMEKDLFAINYGDEINDAIEKIKILLEKDMKIIAKYPTFWLALKILENDRISDEILQNFSVKNEIFDIKNNLRNNIESKTAEALEPIIAKKRYENIAKICETIIEKTEISKKNFTEILDKIVLHKYWGLPIFALVMFLIFKFTFTFSTPLVNLLEVFFGWLADVTSKIVPEGLFQSLLVDGIISGVGSVFSFFPLILFMFFGIAFFEDTGYMARAAFVMDRIMNKFGLHGKSFLPLMISTNGCAVPGILAARTIDNKRDRFITIMVTPFMICGAKLPIFMLFIGAFFPPKQAGNVVFIMYALSICIALGCAKILSTTVFKKGGSHFMMELPPYHLPTWRGLFTKMWERGWLYIKKAGTTIFLLSAIVWGIFTFPQADLEGVPHEKIQTVRLEKSIAGRLGSLIEPIVKPIGLDKYSGIALISGLAAKEIVVSTFGTIYSLGETDVENTEPLQEKLRADKNWNPLKAIAFLIFCLIYLPCIVATAVFFKETGSKIKWLLFLVFWTTGLAWTASFLVYQLGKFFNLGG